LELNRPFIQVPDEKGLLETVSKLPARWHRTSHLRHNDISPPNVSTWSNVMTNAVSSLSALGRLLIAIIFVRAGINKLGSIAATSATMAGHGIPHPDILVWGAVVVEIGSGLFLILGLFTRWAALVLFFYTLTLALIFHAYWTATGAAVRTESASFYGHLAMMGGMLYVTAFGAGMYSLDALLGWWRPPAAEPYGAAAELRYNRADRKSPPRREAA
jgi:putative oxidoreductase